MPDKVIKGLHEAAEVIKTHVPVRYIGYAEQACHDALTLLQEQEPVKPKKSKAYEKLWLCGGCEGVVAIREPFTEDWYISCDYCPHCGRKVDWDA